MNERLRRTFPGVLPILLTLATLILVPLPGLSQEEESGGAADSPRPIGLQDVLDWERINGVTLSDDGDWLAYRLSPTEGNSEVVVRSTVDETEHRFPIGEVASMYGGGSSVVFSDDSRWLAFTIYPRIEEKDRGGDRGPRPHNGVGILELSTGEMTEVEDVRSFAFAGERSEWIALHRYPPEGSNGPPSRGGNGNGEDRARGVDLILHELATGLRMNLGNVADFGFDESGRWLAWAVDAEGKAGNGVQLRDMESGTIRVLQSDEARYSRLSWADDPAALVVLKGVEDEDYEDSLYSVVGWTGFDDGNGPELVVYDPATDDAFPQGMTVSPNRSPRWSDARDRIFFGIHDVEMTEEAKKKAEEEAEEELPAGEEEAEGEEDPATMTEDLDEDEKPDVVIWHWKEPRIQAMQQVQASRDENFSYLSVYWPGEDRFVRLADDQVENVSPADEGHWAVGYDDNPYELMGNLDGRRYRDVYAIDTRSGEREMVLEQARWAFTISPDGDHYLYYRDGNFHTYALDSGEHRNITADVPTSFINTEDDHNVVDPPVYPRGWTEDGQDALLYDNWDVWRVAVDGSDFTNLTVNGKEEGIRYRSFTQFDPENEPGLDLSEPVYFRPYGEWTKKGGLALMTDGEPGPEMLVWEDASYGAFMKAEDDDTYIVSWATYEEYPNYHVTDARLTETRQITDGYPEQENYLWSDGAMLVDYESDRGDRLQGALHLPANYEEGKRYPTIVYIYERLSQGLNTYTFPTAYGFNKSVYTSNGYAVLMPDITYQIDDPGMSAVWCVLPALEAAIETGVVDPERVGIHGHSWGGYQTSFLITQTDAFAAAVAGAPLTNMISMYSSIYWNSGSANQPIFESSQGRFSGGYFDVLDAYTRNSPVYFAEEVTTPLLLLHNDEDGAVDWNQGIEYYNTLRRLQKPVVMLQYVGENHGLRKEPNRRDYMVRMREFWDHYLKGVPAPEWWTQGVPHLELEEHIDERAKDLVKKKDEKEKDGEKKGGGG